MNEERQTQAMVTEPERPEESGSSRPKRRGAGFVVAWFLAMTAMGAAIGLLIVGVMKFVNEPVTAEKPGILGAKTQALASPTPATNQLAGLHIILTYPALFDQVSQLKNDAQALEQYNISSKKDYRRMMAVSVRSLPSSNLDEDSSYRYRQINPDLYKESRDKVGNEPVAIMTKTDGTEQTLFWAHQGKAVTIAITSTVPGERVGDFMTAIKPTLRWRQ